MAMDLGMPERGTDLRKRVRAFLDHKVTSYVPPAPTSAFSNNGITIAQAIDHYGYSPPRSRTKRTRHP